MSRPAPFETQDGQRWLAKALDPASFNVDVKGLPDQETHNVAVLNYQSQFTIDPPNLHGIAANDGTTFDAEMYLFQHPYMLGVCATYPSGTKDPLEGNTDADIHFGSTTSAPYIRFANGSSAFPRSCTSFINTQIAGDANLKTVAGSFGTMCQKHRVIYGAAQLVPTCSAQDNSGSISVSQQPFVGDDAGQRVVSSAGLDLPDNATDITTYKNKFQYPVKAYRPDDFPDADDNIRNPASLLTRFYEGAYIPYKLKNPFMEQFVVSDGAVAHWSPYWTVGAKYMAHGSTVWTPMVWDANNCSFTSPLDALGNRTLGQADRVALILCTKTGQIVELVWYISFPVGTTQDPTVDYFIQFTIATLNVLNDSERGVNLVSTANSNQMFTYTVHYLNAGVDTTISKGASGYRVNVLGKPIADFPADNVTAVLCKAMNMRGNIALLIRLGVEMQVTGTSIYSPFNHKSPEYDETALKSYLRVIHRMSDGFYGNAATDILREAYYSWIMQQLYDPPQDVDFANRGSYWRGAVRAV